MPNVEKITVALSAELAGMLRDAVDQGEYASASEVIREALRDWGRRQGERQRAITELGRLWDAGLDSGVSSEGAEAFARIRRSLNARVAGQSPE